MQAVILAGGRGVRLGPLTDNMPKPMIPINGKPFLQHQLKLIKSAGISEVLILVGYLGAKIEAHFGDGSKFGLCIEYSHEKTPLGTGGGLKNAENKIRDEFLLLNGDTYLPMNYERLVNAFHQCGKTGMVTVYDNREKVATNNIAILEPDLVTGYNTGRMTHVDAGVYVFNKNILDLIPDNKPCSLEKEIFHKLINEKELCYFAVKHRFYDMGSLRGLDVLKGVLK